MSSLTGKRLGPYTIEERIALGGMAAIYRARQPNTGRDLAVKVLPLNLAGDPKLVARFEREAQVLASLQHPHILPLFDFGRDGEWLYFVTPLIPHGDLGEYLLRYGEALPMPEIRRIFLQLTDALDCAHTGGIVHRDLKPANVLMDARGDCLLSDFGIAKMEGTAALTSVGTALGTPEYMSPEQGTGKSVDSRSDLYALGVILFELATGKLPFNANTATEVLLKHVEEKPPSPRALNPSIPEALEQVILKALAKSPAERYQTAAALGGAVAAAIPERAKPTAPTVEHHATPPVSTPVIDPIAEANTRAAPMVTPVNPAIVASEAPTVVVRSVSSRAPLAVIGVAAAVILAIGGYLAFGRGGGAGPVVTPPPSPPPPPAPPVVETPKPSPPPPAPVAFDDFAGDGAFDAARWTPVYGAKKTTLEKRDGALHIVTREQFKGVNAPTPTPGMPAQFTARVRLAATADAASVGITLSRFAEGALQPNWWATCFLGTQAGATQATPTCTDIAYQKFPAASPVAFDSWHELALAPDASAKKVRFGVDGHAIGELPLPADADDPKSRWFVSLIGWSQNGQPVEGDFDDVVVQ